jgi:Domain of unknown function (DUF4440)
MNRGSLSGVRHQTAEAVLHAERVWHEACALHDLARLDALAGDEFTVIAPDGAVTFRDKALHFCARMNPAAENSTLDQVDVRLYENVAVIIGRRQSRSSNPTRFMDVFVFRDSRWQIVAADFNQIRG